MLAGYQCCCGAYQRATGSSNVHCGRNVFWIFKRTSFMSWMKAGEIESLHHEHRVWGNSWAAHVRLDLSRIYFFQGLRQVIHIVSGQSGQSGQSGYVFHAGCQSEMQGVNQRCLKVLVDTPCCIARLELDMFLQRRLCCLCLTLTEGLQYILLDLGGGCFGMDSFQGRVPCTVPSNWCGKKLCFSWDMLRSGCCRMY